MKSRVYTKANLGIKACLRKACISEKIASYWLFVEAAVYTLGLDYQPLDGSTSAPQEINKSLNEEWTPTPPRRYGVRELERGL